MLGARRYSPLIAADLPAQCELTFDARNQEAMLTVMLAFGTRPEAIKMAPVVRELKRFPTEIRTVVCVSAQHRQMLDQVLRTFGIAPDADLNLMRPGQDLSDLTAAVLMGMRDQIRAIRPDWLLVHGDTTTTLASALAGFYERVPVGHVEAGLRTYDLAAPFPEELNRQVATRLATVHFAPTAISRANLIAEGVDAGCIAVTGNTAIDSVQWAVQLLESNLALRAEAENRLDNLLFKSWREAAPVLITGHRRENFGEGFQNICEAISELAKSFPERHFIYPVHLNPQVRRPVSALLSGRNNVHLIDPLDYLPFIRLLMASDFVLTDSGGIQEEAPALNKPVLVMREVTERPEAMQTGAIRVVGNRHDRIVENASALLRDRAQHRAMADAENPFGDGHAAKKIVSYLLSYSRGSIHDKMI